MQLKHFAILFFLFSSKLSAQPISMALRHRDPSLERLERAIENDRNPGHINKIGDSFLHVAAKRDLGKQIARLMQIQEINDLYLHQNNENKTAIEIAIKNNAPSAFSALVTHLRADDHIRIDNPQRWSLLHLAASLDRAEMIVALIAKIPVNTEDERGWSALDIARLFKADSAEGVLVKHGAVSTNAKDLAFAHFDEQAYDSWIEDYESPLPKLCEVVDSLHIAGLWPNTYCADS